jgi:hypothetical protein
LSAERYPAVFDDRPRLRIDQPGIPLLLESKTPAEWTPRHSTRSEKTSTLLSSSTLWAEHRATGPGEVRCACNGSRLTGPRLVPQLKVQSIHDIRDR